ncbi:MAG: retention module-containing protein, partial [Dechloromonas sp.]|nr:retention module-containing protein [Dechloromonas sp.]
MAQAQVVAQVSVLSGQAFARDSAGNMRRLKLGDVIREGESVVAGQGSKVVLTLADGRELDVHPGETARMDAEVASPVKPDATDSAIANDQKGFKKIASVLTSGGDLDALLDEEAPAAGLAGQGGNEGHTFIELLRIVETVDPLAFQFGTGRDRPLDTFDGGVQTFSDLSVFNVGSDLVVDEAAGTITFTVTRAGALDRAASVSYGTADGTAVAGSDYTAISGVLNFAPGETSKTVTVALNNDTLFEGGETFSLNLSAPINGTLGDATQIGTIVDDGRSLPGGPANDDRPVFNMGSDFVVDEAAGTVTFTVTKTGA